MTSTSYILGHTDSEIGALAPLIATAIGLALEERDSHYWGDYFSLSIESDIEFKLYRNEDPLFDPRSDPPEDRHFRREHPEVISLIEIFAETSKADSVKHAIVEAIPDLLEIEVETINQGAEQVGDAKRD